MEIKEIIQILTTNGFHNEKSELIRLSGDASSREYFRLQNEDHSYIVCIEAPHGQQSKDFSLITSLIKDEINTPLVKLYLPEKSLLVLEDVGDISLKDYFVSNGLKYHKRAVHDIKRYQGLPHSVCQERYFDREKIGFEFDLALDYFLKQYLKVSLTNEEEDIIKRVRENLISYFENHKDVVCHRDYHSNNLYVRDNQLFHIDYQDMRIGPAMYDLVSLVDDCYIQFSNIEKEELFSEFDSDFKNKYQEEYKIVQVQRTFKALGSFAYLSIHKKKNGYLAHVEPNLTKLISVLKSCENPDLKSFAKILMRGQDD